MRHQRKSKKHIIERCAIILLKRMKTDFGGFIAPMKY